MEMSKVTKTKHNEKHFSLRATIPKKICKALDSREGDFIGWQKTNDGKVLVSNQSRDNSSITNLDENETEEE